MWGGLATQCHSFFGGWNRFLKVPVKLLDFSLAIGYSLLEKRLDFLLVIAYSLVDGPTYQKPATDLGSTTGSAPDIGSANELSGVLELFREAASEEFFQDLKQDLKLSSRRRIYDLPLVMWLMMVQRWDGKSTLSTAVQQVVEKRPAVLVGDHKRVREGTVSIHTGAYSDARQKMPVEAAERVSDRVFEHLMQNRARRCRDGTGRYF
jgi:hypothetical protein